MSYYIGIDLGTSSVKLLLVTEKGEILGSVSREYPLSFPHPGWSEQSPEDWWTQTVDGLKELLKDIPAGEVKGIGCGGQMHGLVVLDEKDNVIRPCILWNDGRTQEEVTYLNETIGTMKVAAETDNIAFAGFTAPKLLWMKKHEPENFDKICKVMLPKDYINYKLTGVHCCDLSDASGMLLLDCQKRQWSEEMLEICGIKKEQMPGLYESYEIIGSVKCAELKELQGVKVCAGAGDNAAAAVGTGVVGEGGCNISLGTSGTIFISTSRLTEAYKEALYQVGNSIHAFCHADGGFHLMGCMLSAASCNKWLCEEILSTADYQKEQQDITEDKLGNNHVYFLPYLMGERSPINDVNARGTFTGITMDTSRSDMVQAVLEGVAFAIRDSFEVAKKLGIEINSSRICGGGAKSALWRKIIANVLNITLEIPQTEEGPGYGGAMLAMVGTGVYENVQACSEALIRTQDKVTPDPEIAARYEEKYQKFSRIYPAMKEVFSQIV